MKAASSPPPPDSYFRNCGVVGGISNGGNPVTCSLQSFAMLTAHLPVLGGGGGYRAQLLHQCMEIPCTEESVEWSTPQ